MFLPGLALKCETASFVHTLDGHPQRFQPPRFGLIGAMSNSICGSGEHFAERVVVEGFLIPLLKQHCLVTMSNGYVLQR
jgi:hypothetical protein